MAAGAWWIGVFGLIILGAVGWVVVASKRARSRNDGSPVVSAALTLSTVWTVLSLIGVTLGVITHLTVNPLPMTVPVSSFWTGALPGIEITGGPTATVDGGGFTSAEIHVSGVSVAARITWTISQALWGLVPAAIAATLAVACFQLLAGRAFATTVHRVILIAAIVVAVGGVAASLLGEIAGNLASTELFAVNSAQWHDIPGIDDALEWWPDPRWSLTFPLWPVAAGLGLAALAAIFRYGSSLERDTEGLV